MALDARRRQKKAEKRAKKQRERKTLAHRGEMSLADQLEHASGAPILHAYIGGDVWQHGITNALISRSLPGSRVACVVFLVDVYCLGVKDVTMKIMPRIDYDELLDGGPLGKDEREEMSPADIRALVEGAVAFAHSVGISPHRDYEKGCLIFGDVDAAQSDEQFTFGRNGKPFYVAGPNDSPGYQLAVVDRLRQHQGEGKFDYLVPAGGARGIANLAHMFGLSHDVEDSDDDERNDLSDDAEWETIDEAK